MKRYSKSDFEFIDTLSAGTAAAFLGRNKITGKKGIFKDNGCMLGLDNDDVREKLASQIITEIGQKCAQIDLVYDEELGQNACFSNYILEDDEILIRPVGAHNNDNDVVNYIQDYIEDVKKINDDPKFLEDVRKDMCKYIYISCIIDCYDVQNEIIQNEKTGETKVAPWFDFGVAFNANGYQRKAFFANNTSEVILKKLYDNYFDDIADISENMTNILTSDKIEELFSQDYVVEAFEKDELEEIKKRFEAQIEKSKELRKEKVAQIESEEKEIQLNKEQLGEEKKISNFFSKLKQRITGLKNIFFDKRMLLDIETLSNTEETINEKANILDSLESRTKLHDECEKLTNDVTEIVFNDEGLEINDKKTIEKNIEI